MPLFNTAMKRILPIIMLLALTSCMPAIKYIPLESSYNEDWVGKTYTEILRHYGAPSRVESDGQDGKILVYEKTTKITNTSVNTHNGMFDPDYTTTVRTDTDYAHFFIDSDNVCYLVKTNRKKADPASVRHQKAVFWGSTGISFLSLLLIGASMGG